MPSSNPSPGPARADLFRSFLLLIVFIGVIAAGRSALNRYNTERDNRRVEIAVDYTELRTLAAAEGVPITSVLEGFKAAGVTSVAVQEETIAGLQENHLLDALPLTTDHQVTVLRPGEADGQKDSAISNRVLDALKAKTRYTIVPSATGAPVVNQPWSVVRTVGIGLDPDTVDAVHAAGLGIVGRVGNWSGITPQGLVWTLDALKKQGVSTVLFSGDEVLGFKGYVSKNPKDPEATSTAEELKNLGLYYGAIEFGKQKGDPELARATPENTVRVHTIPGSEMATVTEPEAVQRFGLAARERNIRLLFVRLFLDETNPIAFNTAYIGKIVKALHRGNLETGIAHGYKPLSVGTFPRLLIGLGVGAAFVLLLDAITGLLSGDMGVGGALIALIGGLGLAGLAAAPVAMGPKLVALAAAILFPSLALLRSDLLDTRLKVPAIGRFFFACLLTVFGIVCVIGLLSDRIFLVKADAFVGIKATLAVPVLIVALVYALDLRARPGRPFRQAINEAGEMLTRLIGEPVLIWQIIAGVFALALLYVVIARSGNESGVGVSGTELKIRALLDRLLYARPRFKDMFGHAAMIMALLLVTRTGRRNWALPLFLLGAFGQVSLLNTFCHLHTPILISIWRALLGIVIGLGSGLIVYAILDNLLLRRLPPLTPPAPEKGTAA